jgi:methylated-DNA-[protein]-cysteine S-methyltransferase
MKCLNLLLKIPKGKITTYQELAHALGTRAYRAVGSAMAKNQYLNTYPCYKVIKSNGEVGEYSGKQPKKIELLEKEGIQIKNLKVQNLKEVLFTSEDFLKN